MIVHYSESPSDEYIAINLQADIDYIDYLQQKWDQGTFLSTNPVRKTPTSGAQEHGRIQFCSRVLKSLLSESKTRFIF